MVWIEYCAASLDRTTPPPNPMRKRGDSKRPAYSFHPRLAKTSVSNIGIPPSSPMRKRGDPKRQRPPF
jgi:hypothetical protein